MSTSPQIPTGVRGSATTSVQIVELSAGYSPRREILNNLTFECGAGIHAVVGENGRGKTTLLRVLAGVLPPTRGTYLVDGKSPYHDMTTKSRVGYAPHRPALYPNLTVRENLQFWSKALGLDEGYTNRRIKECARDFGLGDLLDRPARVLSRGKAQRLAIARAVFAEPLVLVLDEPAEGLDPGAVQSLNHALESTVRRGGSVFYSSHHVTDVEGYARTIIEVQARSVTTRPAGRGDFPPSNTVPVDESAASSDVDETGGLSGAHDARRSFTALAGALLWRSWRQQRIQCVFLILGSLVLSAALCALVLFAPGTLTGATRAALTIMTQTQTEMGRSGRSPLLAAFLFGQGPFLLAIMAAAAAGNVTRRMIAYDVERGGFEVLLSTPYRPGTLFGAYLLAGLAVTGLTWGCVVLPSIGVSVAASLFAGVTVGHLAAVLTLGLLSSVAMAVWASTATTYVSIKVPVLMGIGSGVSSAIPNLISILPGLVIFGVINIFPGVNLMVFGLVALGASLTCAFAACVALGTTFRPERLLTSH